MHGLYHPNGQTGMLAKDHRELRGLYQRADRWGVHGTGADPITAFTGRTRQSMALSREVTAVMSRVRELSVTAVLARTIFPASTEWVSQTLPPMTQSLPMCVLPPRMVAPE